MIVGHREREREREGEYRLMQIFPSAVLVQPFRVTRRAYKDLLVALSCMRVHSANSTVQPRKMIALSYDKNSTEGGKKNSWPKCIRFLLRIKRKEQGTRRRRIENIGKKKNQYRYNKEEFLNDNKKLILRVMGGKKRDRKIDS